ncbi:MAG: choice-of-anchor D domain-containing protein [bacterium]|nr:choice-of-anchor D domain-containing protein [bacterium]
MWNGSTTQLASFATRTGVTFPLLQQAGNNTDLGVRSSGSIDAMMVIDQNGIIQHIGGSTISGRTSAIATIQRLLAPSAPVLQLSVETLVFGPQITAGQPASSVLTFTNTGAENLEITQIQADLPEITLNATEFTILPGKSAELRITFNAEAGGSYSGTLILTTNDPERKQLQISIAPITVIDLPGRIALQTQALDFGEIEVSRTTAQPLIITNEGDGPLQISGITSNLQGVSVSQQTFKVPPGESHILQINIAPGSEGSFAGTLTLSTDDPDRSTVVLTLSGSAAVIFADPRVDFNGDGAINLGDFIAFARAFGTANPTFDLNENNTVDFGDFVVFARSFGRPLP